MPDDPTTNPESPPPAGAQNTEHMIPKARLDAVISERNTLRERLEQLEAAQRELEAQRLKEQNDYKALYEQAQEQVTTLQRADAQATRFREALAATNAARVEAVPDERRSLIPEYDDPVKLGAWLDANLEKLTGPSRVPPPKADGGAGTGSGTRPPSLTDEERAFAAAMGISEADYAKQKARRQRNEHIDVSTRAQRADQTQE